MIRHETTINNYSGSHSLLEADLAAFDTRGFWGKPLNLESRGFLPMVELLMES